MSGISSNISLGALPDNSDIQPQIKLRGIVWNDQARSTIEVRRDTSSVNSVSRGKIPASSDDLPNLFIGNNQQTQTTEKNNKTVSVSKNEGLATGIGMVLGGIGGAVAGSFIAPGAGTGTGLSLGLKLGTLAGVAVGGFIGHRYEK